MSTGENQRKLGKNQVEFLELLRSHRGQWHRGSKWVWKAPSETIRILEALERRGYVAQAQGQWRMSPAGRAALREALGESANRGHAAAA
jgi:ribosomal protein S19E (S16A)